jgi:hypothetical protein
VKAEKLPKPQAPAPKSKPEVVNVGGRKYSINLILPAAPGLGSQFWPRGTPLPPKTLVDRKFAREIEQHRVTDAEPAAAEPRVITLSFNPGEMYELSPDGRRYANQILRQTREQMLAQQEDDQLREQAAEERRTGHGGNRFTKSTETPGGPRHWCQSRGRWIFDFFYGSQQNLAKAMKLSSAMIAVLASLLIIGCATKQQQLTPAHSPTKKWEKEQNQY